MARQRAEVTVMTGLRKFEYFALKSVSDHADTIAYTPRCLDFKFLILSWIFRQVTAMLPALTCLAPLPK
jgi:hypothetical protein